MWLIARRPASLSSTLRTVAGRPPGESDIAAFPRAWAGAATPRRPRPSGLSALPRPRDGLTGAHPARTSRLIGHRPPAPRGRKAPGPLALRLRPTTDCPGA